MSEKKGKDKEARKPVNKEQPETAQAPVAKTPAGEQTEQTQATEVQETILETDSTKNTESVETSIPETVKEQVKIAGEFARVLAAKRKEQPEFIAPYAKAYPGERAFHVTSDKQVFLERDRGLAVLHQNSLGNEEKVQTIKVK